MVIAGIDELRTMTGAEVGVSRWYTIDQERIDGFARITEDPQWIHVDAERAATESPYGATIAHGFLTLSLLSEMSRDAIDLRGEYKMRINYGLNRVRFPSAVPAGSRVRGRFTVGNVEEVTGGVQVTWVCVVEVEGQAKPALAAEWLIRILT
ncbi:MAG: MaoC family dehydratase [Bryobacteraceae bacterium]